MISSKNSILSQSGFQQKSDFLLVWVLRTLAVLAGSLAALILVYLFKESQPVFGEIGLLRFFTDDMWSPTNGYFNLAPMIAGTLIVTALAVGIATPLGVFSAIFCNFYASHMIAGFYRRIMELLAGLPSVVYGFWGLMVLVPYINEINPPGASILAAGIILGIMILPTIAMLSDAALTSVPSQYLMAAHALGLQRSGILKTAVFPAAKSGIFTGVILGTGRAIGETMAVLMVCGNVVQLPTSIFDPARTLTANIALEMAYATGSHRSALFASGFFLLVLIIILVGIAESISTRFKNV